ncbi:MAG TPA: YkgJ family cysteine cluster protein [Rhabdochlamydiaceae bacterium]|nr:YkgJ family cysteine cluster protein [Rhabdochlamydiaceae bacterium]
MHAMRKMLHRRSWVCLGERRRNSGDGHLFKNSKEEFIRTYTRQVNGRLSLKEFPKSYDCIFLRGKQCLLYGSRPKQCRTFPFWPENVESKKNWEETAKRCEGINHEHAPVIPLSEIERQLKILDE